MTAQIHDIVRHDNRAFPLVGINGTGLFNPQDHGIVCAMFSTGHWRGYVCCYEIRQERLELRHALIGLETREQAESAPTLFGVVGERCDWDSEEVYEWGKTGNAAPRGELWRKERAYAYPVRYVEIQAPISFSGGLLLADDFIRDYYIHQGYQRAYAFREVHEYLFEDGRLMAHRDVSQHMSAIRKEHPPQKDAPDWSSLEGHADWIEKRYCQEYRLPSDGD